MKEGLMLNGKLQTYWMLTHLFVFAIKLKGFPAPYSLTAIEQTKSAHKGNIEKEEGNSIINIKM